MTLKKHVDLISLNLQLFADGGGASAGAPSTGNTAAVNSAGENTSTASNPIEDEATVQPKVIYGKQENSIPERKSFEELVKGDYKDEAKAYMDKAFSRRMGKMRETNDGLSAENAKMRQILEMSNIRYGLDPASATFLDDFAAKVQDDTKLYEDEALEAGMKVEDYIKLKKAESIIEQNKRVEADREANEMIQNHIQKISDEAKQLVTEFPNFDLEAEFQNEKFRKLIDPPELGGSGISVRDAFFAVHHNEIMKSYAQAAASQATEQVANAIANNKTRPSENGLSKRAPATVKDDPSKFTKEDFDNIHEEFLRTGYRPKF